MKPQFVAKESFSWITPDWQAIPYGKKTVKIKGVALPSGVVSRNKRKYVDEELLRAARTLSGKPISINHAPLQEHEPGFDRRKIVGNVIHAEYENGAIEYIGQVKKEPYMTWLRERDAHIKGVSVQAGYLHNRCVYCGDRFYTEEDFSSHMLVSHGVKDPVKEVHGIIFDALSIVVDPEVPGVVGATAELWETLAHTPLRLLETVTQTKKEEENYMKKLKSAAVTPQKRIPAIPKKVREQEEQGDSPPVQQGMDAPSEPCPEGQHRNEKGECEADEVPAGKGDATPPETKIAEQEPTEQQLPEPSVVAAPVTCPEGFEPDEHGECKATELPAEPTAKTPAPLIVPEPTIEPAKTEVTTPAPAAATGPVIEQEEHGDLPVAPFPEAPPEGPPELTKPCEDGSHYDKLAGTCVPDDTIPVDVSDFVKEFKLPQLLKFNEFGGTQYSSMSDCTSKNQDKGDPEAYCADIMRKSHGETLEEVYDPKRRYIDQLKIRESISNVGNVVNQDTNAIAKLFKRVQAVEKALKTQGQVGSKLRATEDIHTRKTLNMYAKRLCEAWRKREKLNRDYMRKLQEALDSRMKVDREYTAKKLSQIATFAGKTHDTVEKTVKGYADLARNQQQLKNQVGKAGEQYEALNKLQQRFNEYVKEQEEKPEPPPPCPEGEHRNEEGECVKDKPAEPSAAVEEIRRLKETFETRFDNLDAKFRGDFKGRGKPLGPNQPEGSTKKLSKTMRKTAR